MHDLVVRNGKIVDGTGGPSFSGDIAVSDGQITAIGDLNERGKVNIDTEGRVVAPGFIDVHTHYDVQGFWDTTLTPSPLHGVTTVFGGNCGFSVAPIDETSSDYMMRTLARVEGMPIESLQAGAPWDWRTTGEFLDRLDGTLAINTGFMVGHTALRRAVMGQDSTRRHATAEEIGLMQGLLRIGIEAGAIGFSSSWSPTHNDSEGLPVPSRHAEPAELIGIVFECFAIFRGLQSNSFQIIPTNHSMAILIELMIQMSLAARSPLNWNVMNANAGNVAHHLERLGAGDEARKRGAKVIGLVITSGTDAPRFSFSSGFVLDQVPGWLPATTGTIDARAAVLADPSAAGATYGWSR